MLLSYCWFQERTVIRNTAFALYPLLKLLKLLKFTVPSPSLPATRYLLCGLLSAVVDGRHADRFVGSRYENGLRGFR